MHAVFLLQNQYKPANEVQSPPLHSNIQTVKRGSRAACGKAMAGSLLQECRVSFYGACQVCLSYTHFVPTPVPLTMPAEGLYIPCTWLVVPLPRLSCHWRCVGLHQLRPLTKPSQPEFDLRLVACMLNRHDIHTATIVGIQTWKSQRQLCVTASCWMVYAHSGSGLFTFWI